MNSPFFHHHSRTEYFNLMGHLAVSIYKYRSPNMQKRRIRCEVFGKFWQLPLTCFCSISYYPYTSKRKQSGRLVRSPFPELDRYCYSLLCCFPSNKQLSYRESLENAWIQNTFFWRSCLNDSMLVTCPETYRLLWWIDFQVGKNKSGLFGPPSVYQSDIMQQALG